VSTKSKAIMVTVLKEGLISKVRFYPVGRQLFETY